MLYIHIPFCKSRCIYCNFFSTTLLRKRREYVDAIISQLPDKKYSSIYLGGGTPSMLDISDLKRLLSQCRTHLKDGAEFTIECNPDDVNEQLAQTLSLCGVNRVSLGIQTFSNERLRMINRRHTAAKAKEAVALIRTHNINNVSIDLMFGFPGETLADLQYDIQEAIKLQPTHISAYCLSVEDGTMLQKLIDSNRLPSLPIETELEKQYYTLCEMLKDAGYEHYEISNFCLSNYHSRHNSGYWQDKSYDAIGAGAHGYSKEEHKRFWNIQNVERYVSNAKRNISVIEEEEYIDEITHYNDLITTVMRTRQGLSYVKVKADCPTLLYNHFKETAKRLAKKQLVEIITVPTETSLHENSKTALLSETYVRISPNKLFISDNILSEFIFLE